MAGDESPVLSAAFELASHANALSLTNAIGPIEALR
jgi:hypothetical protein